MVDGDRRGDDEGQGDLRRASYPLVIVGRPPPASSADDDDDAQQLNKYNKSQYIYMPNNCLQLTSCRGSSATAY